jgi:hypothetical protein
MLLDAGSSSNGIVQIGEAITIPIHRQYEYNESGRLHIYAVANAASSSIGILQFEEVTHEFNWIYTNGGSYTQKVLLMQLSSSIGAMYTN